MDDALAPVKWCTLFCGPIRTAGPHSHSSSQYMGYLGLTTLGMTTYLNIYTNKLFVFLNFIRKSYSINVVKKNIIYSIITIYFQHKCVLLFAKSIIWMALWISHGCVFTIVNNPLCIMFERTLLPLPLSTTYATVYLFGSWLVCSIIKDKNFSFCCPTFTCWYTIK